MSKLSLNQMIGEAEDECIKWRNQAIRYKKYVKDIIRIYKKDGDTVYLSELFTKIRKIEKEIKND